MSEKVEILKSKILKKLIKKTSLKNLELKPFKGSVISREFKKIAIMHPFIYKEILDAYQYFILNQSSIKYVVAFAKNNKHICFMNYYKLRKKIIERGTIQEIIDFMQAYPEIPMGQETIEIMRKLERYSDLFGKDFMKWNEAGFTSPNERIYIDRQSEQNKNKTTRERIFTLTRYDNVYFKHRTQEEVVNEQTKFLSGACYKLALLLPNANIEFLQNKILQFGIESDIINFAYNVKGADKDLINKFYDSKNNSNSKKVSLKSKKSKSIEEKLVNNI